MAPLVRQQRRYILTQRCGRYKEHAVLGSLENPSSRPIGAEESPRGSNVSTAVILSAAKDLSLGPAQILRCAQDDKWRAGPEAFTSARAHRSFLASVNAYEGRPGS